MTLAPPLVPSPDPDPSSPATQPAEPPPAAQPAPPPRSPAPSTGPVAGTGSAAARPARRPHAGLSPLVRHAVRADDLERLRALARDIGAEARDVTATLAFATTALAIVDPDARVRSMGQQLDDLKRNVAGASDVVTDRLAKLRSLLEADDRAYDQYGDEILTISNLWSRAIATLPQQYTLADHVACEGQITAADQALGELVWHVALVTIPARLNQHLLTMAVGGRLDFAATFSDELPDPAMQRRLLDYLSGHPLFIAGVVDKDAGVIYKASQNRWRRLASYLLIVGLAIPGGVGLIKILTDGIPPLGLAPGWLGIAPGRLSGLLPAYAFLMLGAGFHIATEALRQGQRGTLGSFTALGDWLTWIHVREAAIAGGVLVAWGTLAGLAISLPAGQLTWQTALFAGYGIDSVFGLFVNRFDTIATGGLSKLTPIISGLEATATGK